MRYLDPMKRLALVLLLAAPMVKAKEGKVMIGLATPTKWDKGFSARITITNQASWTIHDWRLEFELAHPIQKIWNGRVASTKGRRVVLRAVAASWEDGDLSPGEKATVDFIAEGKPAQLPLRLRPWRRFGPIPGRRASLRLMWTPPCGHRSILQRQPANRAFASTRLPSSWPRRPTIPQQPGVGITRCRSAGCCQK